MSRKAINKACYRTSEDRYEMVCLKSGVNWRRFSRGNSGDSRKM